MENPHLSNFLPKKKLRRINICANQLTTGYIKVTLTRISAVITKISFSFILLECSV